MKGKISTLMGTVITLAITNHIAVAQPSQFPNKSETSSISSATEIKMTPEGMKILCEFFPLNSRCSGSVTANPQPTSNTTTPTSNPADSKTSPEDTKIPTTPTSSHSDNLPNTTP